MDVSLAVPIGFMEHRGPPGSPGRPLYARQSQPCRRSPAAQPFSDGRSVVFVECGPLDLRKYLDFVTVVPLAHVFARLRIDHPIIGNLPSHSGRKADYRLVGLHLRRTGFAPAGRLIAFQKGLTSLHSREPALSGRTASQICSCPS